MSNFSRNWALVIGINNYINGIPGLQNAVNDAKSLAELLREKYGYEVWEYIDEAATLDNLHDLLLATLPKQITANDRLLFYFAGHGIALNSDEELEGFLIPQDAKLRDVQTYLPMTLLHECLSKLPCRHFLGILDCCFAGAFRWSSISREILAAKTVYKERYERFIADPAWQIITSASYNQKALDAFALNNQRGLKGKHSPFAFSLLEALEGKADLYPPGANGKPPGDGVITATELYLYLRGALESISEERWQKQTPGIFPLKKHDKGEYIFLTPGHVLNLPSAPPLDESKNPYRGLESFDEEHSKLFFGRQELIENLHEFVKKQPLTVVLGASGTGKSSLVKAGLIPYIKKLESWEQEWFILPSMRPGESPFRALNNVLTSEKLLPVDLSNGNYQQAIDNLKARMTVWCERNPNKKLLFVVDQLEEVITLCRNEQERENFLNFLTVAVENYSDYLRIVLTLRNDFVAQFHNAHLRKYWLQARFIVAPMTREDLRKAIEEPAVARVMYFDPHNLVEQLLDDVAQMPGALPLLSFTLSQLYLKYLKSCRDGSRDNRTITQQDYEELGGVIQSLTQRADCECTQLVKQDIAYAQTIRHVMLRMIAVGGSEATRRRVLLSELEYPPGENERVQKVIHHFTDARLLVKGEDIDGHPYVEPAHDALVHGWHKLLVWKHENEESLILQRQLTPAALDWISEKSARFLWNNNPRLSLLKQILNSNNNWLNKVETEFVQQSLKRKSQVAYRNLSLVIGVILSLSSTTIFAVNKAIDAQKQLLESNSVLAENLMTSNHELEALVKATKAGEMLKKTFAANTTKEDTRIRVLATLQKVINGVNERNRLVGKQIDSFESVSFSPDGKIIAAGSNNGIINLWDSNGKPLQELVQQQKNSNAIFQVIFSSNGQTLISASSESINIWRRQRDGSFTFDKLITNIHEIMTLALSPDGKTIAASNLSGKNTVIKLWNLNGKLLNTLQGYADRINDLSFSKDGLILASASADKTIKLWNIKNGKQLKTITDNNSVFAVRFIDNQTIATAGADPVIKFWDLKDGKNKKVFKDNNYDVISHLALSQDSRMIASIDNRAIKIWSIDGTRLHTLYDEKRKVTDVSFSLKNNIIASANGDNIIRIWDFDNKTATAPKGSTLSFSPNNQIIVTGEEQNINIWKINGQRIKNIQQAHNGFINKISFSPDGKKIASASADYTVKLWDMNGKPLKPVLKHEKSVTSISFSPNSQMIASGSVDKTMKLWDINKNLTKTFVGHKDFVTSVSFSPDGKIIASGSSDGIMKLWNLDGKLLKSIKISKKGVSDISFSPNGKMIATGSEDKTVTLWDLNTFFRHQDIRKLDSQSHKDTVFRVKFSPDGRTLASASETEIMLWTLDGAALLLTEQNYQKIEDISFSPDGKSFAVSDSGKIKVLNLDVDKLLKLSCNWLHDYLANSERRSSTTVCNEK